MSTTTTRPRCARCGMLPEALIHTGDHPTNCHPFTTTLPERYGERALRHLEAVGVTVKFTTPADREKFKAAAREDVDAFLDTLLDRIRARDYEVVKP